MYVGNEYYFKPDTPYYNENGRLKMMPPKWGCGIYMWWSFKEHICSNGNIRRYKYFNFSVGGQREQYYCRPGEHYPRKFIDLHLMDFLDRFSFYFGSYRAHAYYTYKPKKKKIKRKHGRPKAFSFEVYELLEAAGFGANGSDIVIKYKKYLTETAAAFRFNLLSDDDKTVIGDAGTLLKLSQQAFSLLKSRNRKSINTSFEQCFHDNIIQKIDSVGVPSADRLHEALSAA